MKILILSNGAPKYFNFFNSLANKLKSDNHEITFAVDCKTSLDENKILINKFPHDVFSEYFAQHIVNKSILEKYNKYNLNSALLSDYDRAILYRIWGQRNNDFYEKLKSALLSFFEEIFAKKNIEVVIYENVSNSFAHFCWFVCQEYGVRYLGLTGCRLPGRFWITDEPCGEHLRVDKTFNEIINNEILPSKEVISWCEDYIHKIEEITPDYMRFNNLDNTSILNKYLRLEKVKKIATGIRHLRDDHYHSYQRGNPLKMSWHLFLRSLRRKLKLKQISSHYKSPISGEKFLLYPLHFHPESSTSILSGTYLDELEVIRNIAFNLPQGIKLYVKDHISAFGYPTLDFYRKISNLPNVCLLAPNAPTKKLIQASQAVITLTSTVGYEALLLNKRVFLFGEVFYKNHKNVVKIENPSNLFQLLTAHLSEIENDHSDLEYNINFVAAYYMNTYPGTLNMMLENEMASALVDTLYPYIKIHLASKINSDSETQEQTTKFDVRSFNW